MNQMRNPDEDLSREMLRNLSTYRQAQMRSPEKESEPFRRQFLEKAMTMVPAAKDPNQLRQYFPELDELMRSGGTNFSPGLDAAAQRFDAEEKARKKAAQKAKQASVQASTSKQKI